MGGRKKPIVGYENDLGVHFVLGLGPIDGLLKIEVDKLPLWEGFIASGRFSVDKPELLGGREREGGISGFLDLLPGFPDQAKNDYLQHLAGDALISAYRGLASVVLRQVYIGNNPYLKPWAFRVQRVFTGYDGAAQWYPEKAGIFRGFKATNSAIYLALDGSSSMDGEKWENQIAAVIGFLEAVKLAQASDAARNDIKIVIWGSTILDGIEIRNCSQDDYDALILWLTDLVFPGDSGTNFNTAVSLAPEFFVGLGSDILAGFLDGIGKIGTAFGLGTSVGGSRAKRRVLMFVTDGAPSDLASVPAAVATIATIAKVEVFAFNIEDPDTSYAEEIDNTPQDGVPVVTGGDPEALLAALQAAFSLGYDMNPAHILREVLLDPDVGGSGDAGEVDDDVFEAAADVLFDEAFGLSFHWRNLGSRQEFIDLVERHIDAKVYQDRQSGLWGLKLLRRDYDPDTIPAFGPAEILEWESPTWPDPFELPNYVTVIFTDTTKEDDGSISLGNPARIQQAGGQVNRRESILKGIHNAELAARCCARDLASLSAPLFSAVVVLRYFPVTINRGDAIKLTDETIGVLGVVCRVLEIVDGDGRENSVRVRVIEDRFGRMQTGLAVVEPPPVVVALPAASDPRLVEEAPFYSLVQELGQASAESTLEAQPFAGFVSATGKSPYPQSVNALYNFDDGDGYEQSGFVDFAPVAVLRSVLSRDPTQTKAFVDLEYELSDVRIGSLARVNGEYVSVLSIDAAGTSAPGDYWHPPTPPPGAVVLVEFGRGCLDSIPREHVDGSPVIFWQDFAGADGAQYLSGESVDVKLQPFGPEGTLPIDLAPIDTVNFTARASRPYPAGNFQVDGDYLDHLLAWPFEVTWAHRDRLLQTTAVFDDFTTGDIGPEPGTTYTLRISTISPELAFMELNLEVTGLTGTSITVDEADLDLPIAPEAGSLLVEVISERDGFTSRDRPYVSLYIVLPPADLAAIEVSGDVQLDWSDVNSGLRQESEHRVYRSTSTIDPDALPSPLATLAADTTTYLDTTVTPGATYFYLVSAFAGTQERLSAEVTITLAP